MKRQKNRKPGKQEWNIGVSRRDFLRGAGAAVSTGILAVEGLAQAGASEGSSEVLGPGTVSFNLRINGRLRNVSVEPRVTLLDTLREHLDLTGAKRVCDRGTCGACTVMVDGKPVYACSMLAIDAQGREIRTIEGLASEGELSPVMRAFVQNDAPQCGFCTPGFVVAATALLEENPHPSVAEVNRGLGGNICRCGTYHGLRQAALDAARSMKS